MVSFIQSLSLSVLFFVSLSTALNYSSPHGMQVLGTAQSTLTNFSSAVTLAYVPNILPEQVVIGGRKANPAPNWPAFHLWNTTRANYTTVQPTFPDMTLGSLGFLRNGIMIQPNQTNPRRMIVAVGGTPNYWLYDINLNNNSVYFGYGPNLTSANAEQCIADWRLLNVWCGSAGRFYRIGIYSQFPSGGKTISNANGIGPWSTVAAISNTSAYAGTLSTVVADKNFTFAYFATTAGFLYRVSLTTTSLSNATLFVTLFRNFGVGSIYTMMLDETARYFFVATAVSIIMRYDLDNLRGGYLIIYEPSLGAAPIGLLDERPGYNTTYWFGISSTSIGFAMRVPHDTFSTYDSIGGLNGNSTHSFGTTPTAVSWVHPTNRNQALVLGNSNTAWTMNLYNCAMFKTCGDCMSEPFCGWCVTNGGVCMENSSCPVSAPFIDDSASCPQMVTINPPLTNQYGNISVTITANIIPAYSSLYRCLFNSSNTTTPVVSMANNMITCLTPSNSSLPAGTYPFNVFYNTSANLVFPVGNTLTIFNCGAATSCGACRNDQRPDCVWCLGSGTCTAAAQCQPDLILNTTSQCPLLLSATPSQAQSSGSFVINVTTSFVYSSLTTNVSALSCTWVPQNGVGPTFSSLVLGVYSNNTAYCASPPTGPWIGNYSLHLVNFGSSNTYAPFFNSSYGLNFLIYNCAAATTCEECMLGDCQWCPWANSGSPCAAGGGQSFASCNNYNVVQLPSQCPRITSVAPLSSAGREITNFTLNGNRFVPPSTSPSNPMAYDCYFYNATGGGLVFGPVAANWLSSTAISCSANGTNIPSAVLSVGVGIRGSARVYTPDRTNITFYDCSLQTSCETCYSATLRPECTWCPERACININNGACPLGSSISKANTTCPTMNTLAPTEYYIGSGNNITVTLSGSLLSQLPYTCQFTNILTAQQFTTTAAYINSSTTIMCPSPILTDADAGNFALELLALSPVDSQWFPFHTVNSSKIFFVYACGSFDKNCISCQAHPECDYCAPFSCTDIVTGFCPSNFVLNGTQCPTMTSISRDYFSTYKAINFQIYGGPFSPDPDYSLILNGTTIIQSACVAYFGDTSSVDCNLPPLPYGPVTVTVIGDNQTYVYNSPIPVEIYDCSRGNSLSSCGACAANPSSHCGWCWKADGVVGARCLDTDDCDGPLTHWSNDTCPYISSTEPSFASLTGNTTLLVNANSTLWNDFNYSCIFTETTTHSTWRFQGVQYNDTTILCQIDPITFFDLNATMNKRAATSESFTMTLFSGNQSHTDPFINSYSFLNCSLPEGSNFCDSCFLQDSRCSYCQAEGRCDVASQCNSSFIAMNELSCATIIRIDPVTLDLVGGSFSFVGTSFFDYPTLECVIGGVISKATFVSATRITCNAPAVDATTTVSVNLRVNNKTISRTSQSLAYTSLNQIVSSGLPQAAAIGLIVGLGVFFIIIIVLLIIGYVVYKKRLAKKIIKEPNYKELAIGNTFQEWKYSNSNKKLYDELALLLREMNFQIPVLLTDLCPQNELDKICKALVFATEGSLGSQAGNMINRFVSEEITKIDDDVVSLFRQNSPVAKMISHYDKLIGLKFLWATLAIPVHELNDLAVQEVSDNPSTDLGRYSTKDKTAMQSSFYRSTSFEIDPNKMDEKNKAFLNENVIRLMLYAQHLFNAVVANVGIMPKQLRAVYRHARDRLSSKFPQHERKAVSSLLFLRFVCPSLLTPHVWGLLEEPPIENAQRYLILISKTLHNLSTGTLPGQKEDYMQKLNEFITMNQDAFKDLCDEITDKELIDKAPSFDTMEFLSDENRFQALAYLHHILHQERDNLVSSLGRKNSDVFGDSSNSVNDRVVQKFNKVMNELGEPITPKKS